MVDQLQVVYEGLFRIGDTLVARFKVLSGVLPPDARLARPDGETFTLVDAGIAVQTARFVSRATLSPDAILTLIVGDALVPFVAGVAK